MPFKTGSKSPARRAYFLLSTWNSGAATIELNFVKVATGTSVNVVESFNNDAFGKNPVNRIRIMYHSL